MQTENGKRNVAAVIFIPVSAEMAAEAPSNMFAQAIMLLMRQSTIQMRCAAVPGTYQCHQFHHRSRGCSPQREATRYCQEDLPYRIRTISSRVCASGIFILLAMPSTAKNTIIGLQPAANLRSPSAECPNHYDFDSPERSCNTIRIPHKIASKHRSAPQPAGNDGRSGKTSPHAAV